MGLVLELTLKGLTFLPEVVAGTVFNIDENARHTDPFKIGPVFPIEGFAAGAHESLDAGAFEVA